MDARALQSTPSPRQQGSALFVSLVFLMILTILGVSSMGTARLELKMAANSQFANQAFQASESGIEATLRETDIYATADTDGVDHAYCFNQVDGGPFICDGTNYAERVQTNTLYETTGHVPIGGYSLGLNSNTSVKAHHFRILSLGEAPAGAQDTHVQGIFIVGPG